MYLEFKLPTGAGGMAAHHYNNKLRHRVQAWANQYNITIKSWTKGYRSCYEFAKDSDYTLFALSWQANNIWEQYEIVKD